MTEKEHLAQFVLMNGAVIDMHRQDGDVTLSSKDHQVTVPRATGQQTLDLIAFLEPLGESVSFPGEETEGDEANGPTGNRPVLCHRR